jgi:hypothetical protein
VHCNKCDIVGFHEQCKKFDKMSKMSLKVNKLKNGLVNINSEHSDYAIKLLECNEDNNLIKKAISEFIKNQNKVTIENLYTIPKPKLKNKHFQFPKKSPMKKTIEWLSDPGKPMPKLFLSEKNIVTLLSMTTNYNYQFISILFTKNGGHTNVPQIVDKYIAERNLTPHHEKKYLHLECLDRLKNQLNRFK